MRDNSIDCIKGVFIFLVVWMHISLGILLNQIGNTTVMSVFFFLSGMFFKDRSFKGFMQNIGKKLLLPFCLFALLGYIYHFLFASFIDNVPFRYLMLFTDLWNGCDYDANIPLWFLVSLIEINLIFWLLRNQKLWLILIVSVALSISGAVLLSGGINNMYVGKTLLYSMPFSFGYIFAKKRASIDYLSLPVRSMLFATGIVLLLLKIYLIHNNIINLLSGLIVAFLTLPLMLKNIPTPKAICWLGKNSLVILCCHILTNELLWRLLYPYFHTPNVTLSFFYAIGSVILCIPVVFAYNYMMSKVIK